MPGLSDLAAMATRALGVSRGGGTSQYLSSPHHIITPSQVYYPARLVPSTGIPLPVSPGHTALEELLQLAKQFNSGQDAESVLSRMLYLIRIARQSRELSPQQKQTVEAVADSLETWDRIMREQVPTKPDSAEEEDDVEILGRADVQQWPKDMREDLETMIRTPGSSNVYAFTWIQDDQSFQAAWKQRNPDEGRVGTMIVTFKDWAPGQTERTDTPGTTYAYSNVPYTKYQSFLGETSHDSAGYAVWDYLRLRGTLSGHQHPYRLLSVTGEYIPRKATSQGFRQRTVPASPYGSVEHRRSTLPPGDLSRFGVTVPTEPAYSFSQAKRLAPARNEAARRQRGEPNRGQPNTGRRS